MKRFVLIVGLLISKEAISQEKNLISLISTSETSFRTKKVPKEVYKSSLIDKDEMWIYWIDNSKLIGEYYNELIRKNYQPCDYRFGEITKNYNKAYSKSDTFYFVNKKEGIIVQLMNHQDNGIGGSFLSVSSNWYSPNVRLFRKSEPEYEFENYFTAKTFKKFDLSLIESSKLNVALVTNRIETPKENEIINDNRNDVISIEASGRTLANFEKIILNGKKPIGDGIQTKYDEKQWRLITWRAGSSNKLYNFSLEKMDMLGYEFIKVSISDSRHKVYVYRNCKKNLIFEVTEWFSERTLICNLKWYDKSIKNQIGYFMLCDLK